MNKDLNTKLILRVLGGLLLVESVFLLLPIVVALIYGEYDSIKYYLITIAVAGVLGGSGLLLGRNANADVSKREGAVIVTSVWFLYTLVGALPFTLSGYIPEFTDAFFETLSGFTTTGTSILNNIESFPNNLLFWRSLTHWVGGLGIMVIFLAILPVVGGAGYQLFNAEGTTPLREKFSPRTNEMAKILLVTYFVITALCALALYIAGMNFFDAINHAFSTVATGGFSTKQLSIAYYQSPAIEYVLIFFMFFSGVNFMLFYFLYKLDFNKIRRNEELKYYIIVLMAATVLVFLSHLDFSNIAGFKDIENSFRKSLFIVTSCITTTGLATDDYTTWSSYTWVVLLILMIMGASSYSTSGGMKTARIVIIVKFCYYEFKKLLHPNAIFPVKFSGQVVKEDLIMLILAFAMIYVLIIFLGTLVLNITGLGFIESFSGMITCMSDVGLGLGQLGPTHSFSEIPIVSKWVLAFVMIIGRLEIYSVVLLFTPIFWKR